MCFAIKVQTSKVPKPQITTEDIPVWKVIGKDGYGWLNNLYIKNKIEKWTKRFHYIESTPFVEAYVKYDGWNNSNSLIITGHAFHSKKNRGDAEDIKYSSDKIVRMYIPKGAKYYFDPEDNEYVSSEIVYP